MNTHLVVFIALMFAAVLLIARLFWRYRANYPLQAEAPRAVAEPPTDAAPSLPMKSSADRLARTIKVAASLPDQPAEAAPLELSAEPGTWGAAILGWQAMMAALQTGPEQPRPPAHLLARMEELGGPQAILAARDAQEADFDARPVGMILSGAGDQDIDEEDLPALEAAARAKVRRLKQRTRIARLIAAHPVSEQFAECLEQEIAREVHWRRDAQSRMAELTDDITGKRPDEPMPASEWDELKAFLQGEKCRTWRLMRGADDGIDLERSTLTLWDLFQRGT